MKSAIPVVFLCVLVLQLAILPMTASAQAMKIETFLFFAVNEPFGVYSGACSGVETPSGNVNLKCTLNLLFGDPVRSATPVNFELAELRCVGVAINSGRANLTCHAR